MYDIVLCVYERFRVDGLKRYVNDDRFRVDGDKNMCLLAFAFTIVFVWTGPKKTPGNSHRELRNIEPFTFLVILASEVTRAISWGDRGSREKKSFSLPSPPYSVPAHKCLMYP